MNGWQRISAYGDIRLGQIGPTQMRRLGLKSYGRQALRALQLKPGSGVRSQSPPFPRFWLRRRPDSSPLEAARNCLYGFVDRIEPAQTVTFRANLGEP